MRGLPQGTVTFLFSDIEGSTRLLHELGERYAEVLAEHRRVVREAVARHRGVEVDAQGDGFFVAFASAREALAAAREAQEGLRKGQVRLRVGLHTGEPSLTEEGYVGMDVHRAARVAAAGHGGQVLLSQTTRDLVDADVRDLGEHRLKDLSAPERLYQLGPGDFPPLKTLFQTNLPVQPSPLLGRERELGEIAAFIRGGTRLLTLTGAGGSGKTRLALHAAAELADDFADGVWFVSLAATTDSALVGPTIAQVVGAPADLSQFLRGRELLLVLDNLEQLLPDAAAAIAGLPVRVIATSRERLAVSVEQEYEVLPLPRDDAVALFVERAHRLAPAFEPDEHVAAIVRRVDGLPLAVELAAARVKVLTPAQIEERLGQSLDLLTGGARDAPERQRTLRATIAWSHELLEPNEKRLFARLSVFAGGATFEETEYVCDADLDTVALLVDKNLVRRRGDRYWMLETIREYALERLDERGEHNATTRALARYLLALVEQGSGALRTSRPPAALRDRLAEELDNVRTAVDWAFAAGETELALQLAIESRWFMRPLGGGLIERGRWLERGLQAERDVSSRTRATGLYAAAGVAFVRGDLEQSVRLAERSLRLYRDMGEEAASIDVLRFLGSVATALGDGDRARRFLEHSLELSMRLSVESGTYQALHHLGELERELDNLDGAADFLARSAALARAAGDRYLLPNILHSSGDVALADGDLEGATRYYADALALDTQLAESAAVTYCVAGLATVAAAAFNIERAGRLWGAVAALEHDTGLRILEYERRQYDHVIQTCAAAAPMVRCRRRAGTRDDARRGNSIRPKFKLMDDSTGRAPEPALQTAANSAAPSSKLGDERARMRSSALPDNPDLAGGPRRDLREARHTNTRHLAHT